MSARSAAVRLYPRSPSFQRAFRDGVRAAETGASKDDCPYRQGPGWRQAYYRAWMRGFGYGRPEV